MREIKFRGYDGSEWIYSNSIDYDENEDTYYMKVYDTEYKQKVFVKVTHIGQYTGLSDKNGQEIYDGDIVKINEYVFANTYEDVYKEVRYSNNAEWVAGSSMLSRIYARCEVVGNIYECPEVLEV